MAVSVHTQGKKMFLVQDSRSGKKKKMAKRRNDFKDSQWVSVAEVALELGSFGSV